MNVTIFDFIFIYFYLFIFSLSILFYFIFVYFIDFITIFIENDFNFAEPFQVKGFSATGQVLHSQTKKPVSGASILLNKQFQTTTDEEG